MVSFDVFAIDDNRRNVQTCPRSDAKFAFRRAFRDAFFLAIPFRIRTSKTPLPQLLYNPHLRARLGSAGNKGLITPVESALTENSPVTPLESALTKRWGGGYPLPLLKPSPLLFWEAKNERQPFMAATKRQTKEETHAVTHATVSAHAVKRVFNFNAGPGALPLPVLERIREELLDWRGSGMSVMEMSHRARDVEDILARAEQGLRQHLAIDDDYAVSFLQGGGSLQFTMVPMNLCLPGKPVDVLHTGTWTAKALGELKKGVLHNVAASTEAEKFVRVPRQNEIKLSADPSYVYMCTNNTIEGTQWRSMPESGNAPLVADMSSDIASRPIDVKKFGLIFAGAQKNLGPSGVTVVIVRRDL